MRKLFLVFVTSISLYACSNKMSKEQLTEKVKSDMNVELQKRAVNAGLTLTIKSFDLLHKGGNEYTGILKTQEGETEYTYTVNVTTDGESVMWKIAE